MAGDSGVELGLEIAQPNLAAGKTYVQFMGKISASGADSYAWSITSGTLPAGLSLQGAQSATVTIAGTPTEAGQFPISLSVTDGTTTKTVDVTLVVTHSALFLSDRNVSGVNELFLTEIGAETASAPVRLNASIPAGGGVSSFAWSPDGSKVLYLATQSAGGPTELWVASVATPGSAQRVSAAGVTVSLMAWLRSGNVAAYMTNTGDAYLADLSGLTAGASKLVVSGPGTPSALAPSPNGKSLTVGTSDYDSAGHTTVSTVTYVTWEEGTPKAVNLLKSTLAEPSFGFSYDGRFGATNPAGWWDLSLASPTPTALTGGFGFSVSFSPNAQALVVSDANPSYQLSVGTFDGGSLKLTVLAKTNACSLVPDSWSPDGKNVIFRICANRDIRGINDVVKASADMDFSLLPTGFVSNSFTDIPAVAWSPDSQWVALRADRDVDGRYDLYLLRWSAPGIAHKPHANSTASGVSAWAFAQNSQAVAFVGSIAPQSSAGLYLSQLPPTGAPPPATLISEPASSVVQTDINWLPGSRVIAYRATVSGATQLFALPVTADGTAGSPVSINGVSGSGVLTYQLAPVH
jgi:Tol biopolymer transport system component